MTTDLTVITGAAGTGKTHKILSIIDSLQKQNQPYEIVAFTNRAVQVLQRRGLAQAATIHKTLYSAQKTGNYVEVKKAILDPTTRLPQRDAQGEIVYGIMHEAEWAFMFRMPANPNTTLIVDESSLVPSAIWGNIFDQWPGPVIVVGDQNQLPPVDLDLERQDKRYLNFFLEAAKKPDIDLGGNQNNRRVSAGNSVLPAVYQHIYSPGNGSGQFPRQSQGDYGYVANIKTSADMAQYIAVLAAADIVVAWQNTEVAYINELIRRHQADQQSVPYTPYPRRGDRIIAEQHYSKTEPFTYTQRNPHTGELETVTGETHTPLITRGEEYVIERVDRPDSKNCVIWVLISGIPDAVPLNTAFIDGGHSPREIGAIRWCYASAITCHKAQGSGWPQVIVVDSYDWPQDAQRWRYTAATRASEKLLVMRCSYGWWKR